MCKYTTLCKVVSVLERFLDSEIQLKLKRLSVIRGVRFIEEFNVKKRMERRREIRICRPKGTVRFSVSGKGSFTVFPK
jgi:hypothetical protein